MFLVSEHYGRPTAFSWDEGTILDTRCDCCCALSRRRLRGLASIRRVTDALVHRRKSSRRPHAAILFGEGILVTATPAARSRSPDTEPVFQLGTRQTNPAQETAHMASVGSLWHPEADLNCCVVCIS